jgi:hypothetical protein
VSQSSPWVMRFVRPGDRSGPRRVWRLRQGGAYGCATVRDVELPKTGHASKLAMRFDSRHPLPSNWLLTDDFLHSVLTATVVRAPLRAIRHAIRIGPLLTTTGRSGHPNRPRPQRRSVPRRTASPGLDPHPDLVVQTTAAPVEARRTSSGRSRPAVATATPSPTRPTSCPRRCIGLARAKQPRQRLAGAGS